MGLALRGVVLARILRYTGNVGMVFTSRDF